MTIDMAADPTARADPPVVLTVLDPRKDLR
jgi:hypothetical protein